MNNPYKHSFHFMPLLCIWCIRRVYYVNYSCILRVLCNFFRTNFALMKYSHIVWYVYCINSKNIVWIPKRYHFHFPPNNLLPLNLAGIKIGFKQCQSTAHKLLKINSLFEISRAGLRLLVNNMISSMSEFVQNFQEELFSTVHGALPCSAVVVKPLLGNGAC